MKKGFTLVETLVVIALLAAISVTIGLSFSGMLNKQNDNDEERFSETIESAACLYAEKNDIDTNTSIKIKDLIDQGLIKKNLKNPTTKKKITTIENECVTINWKNNERNCIYSKEQCNGYVLPTVSDIKIKINDNNITATIVAKEGTNKLKKYYFSIDNGVKFIESNSNTYTFQNLSTNTKYTITGKVSDTEDKFSNTFFKDTKLNEYKVPIINKLTPTSTATSIKINVSAKNGDGKITEYYYSKDDGKTFETATKPTYTFNNLTSKTEYKIRVYVKDNNGKGSAISSIAETTKIFTLPNVCESGQTLASCIKDFAKGGSGYTDIYIHDVNYEHGANDGSYRYEGASSKNFVCFGYDSTDGTCPTDNLYRIIGVFDDKVKLIKNDYVKDGSLGIYANYSGEYYSRFLYPNMTFEEAREYYKGRNTIISVKGFSWGSEKSSFVSDWNASLLNKKNLNDYFLSELKKQWSSKIETTTWIVGGYNSELFADGFPSTVYQNEILHPHNTRTTIAKVGLMYASDYLYAKKWIYMGLYEWTITPTINGNCDTAENSRCSAIAIHYKGKLTVAPNSLALAVRPVFYLKYNVTYVSGEGTMFSPMIIN